MPFHLRTAVHQASISHFTIPPWIGKITRKSGGETLNITEEPPKVALIIRNFMLPSRSPVN